MRLHTPKVDPRVRKAVDERMPPNAELEGSLVPCPRGHKHVVMISYGAYNWEHVGMALVRVRNAAIVFLITS